MPKALSEKTASALRHTVRIAIVAVLIIGASFLGTQLRHAASNNSSSTCIPKSLRVGDSDCISMEYAITPTQRERGLSGRDSIRDDQGMIFIFENEDEHCFWMKDMRFSIDIVWLDADKKIIYKRGSVSPSTYPESFCPDMPAKYVIEVNPGLSSGWQKGQQILF